MMCNSISDYQLQELKSGWRVVIPQVRGGKVRGYMTQSPIYKNKADAEKHLEARLQSAREFQAHCAGVTTSMARERERG